MPRRGRLWVLAILGLALFGLGYLVVEISTQKEGPAVVHVEGIGDAQRIYGGIPQEGDRLGSSDAPLLYRHYSNSESPQELSFYGAEAAADQGYGWQYIYLFFRNQNEAERFGIDQDYLDTIAGGIEELNEPEWLEYLEDNGSTDGTISKKLQGYDELGQNLGIR